MKDRFQREVLEGDYIFYPGHSANNRQSATRDRNEEGHYPTKAHYLIRVGRVVEDRTYQGMIDVAGVNDFTEPGVYLPLEKISHLRALNAIVKIEPETLPPELKEALDKQWHRYRAEIDPLRWEQGVTSV